MSNSWGPPGSQEIAPLYLDQIPNLLRSKSEYWQMVPHTYHVSGKGEVGEWPSERTKCICDLKPKPAKAPPTPFAGRAGLGGPHRAPGWAAACPWGPDRGPASHPQRLPRGEMREPLSRAPSSTRLLVVLPDLPLRSHPEGVKSVFRSKCLLPGGKEGESIPL